MPMLKSLHERKAPLTVMIVDDSMITAKRLMAVLEEIGHRIAFVAPTGRDAVENYARFSPDIVTMDITMPDMNGIEATKEILALHPTALIVMVTSHGQESMVLEAIDAGAKGFVMKPINADILRETIDMVITRYRQSA